MKLIKQKNDVAILEGKFCPFRNPLLLPGRMQGQITIEQLPCSNDCPLFVINENKVTIHCGCKPIEIEIEIEQQIKFI
jgi:hypothetical protein